MALKLNQINKRRKAQRRNESSPVPAKTRTMLPWEIPIRPKNVESSPDHKLGCRNESDSETLEPKIFDGNKKNRGHTKCPKIFYALFTY